MHSLNTQAKGDGQRKKVLDISFEFAFAINSASSNQK